jgi:hypothetical protein
MSNKVKIASRVLKDLFGQYSIPFSIRESLHSNNIIITVVIDSSKFHMLGPNYDSEYWEFLEANIEEEIISALELVGLEEDLGEIIYKHENHKFMDDKISELKGILTERLRKITNGRTSNIEILGPYLQDFRPELVYKINFPKDLHPDKQKLLMRSIPSVYDDINFHARV